MDNRQDNGVAADAAGLSPTVEPASSLAGFAASIPNVGFILKAWDVTVVGLGTERIVAASKGAALAKAWRCDAFGSISFKQFLGIATAFQAMFVPEDFGQPITVDGRPAFYIGRNRAHVEIAYADGREVFSAHPYDVLPEHFRPAAYRTTPLARIEAFGRDRNGLDGEATKAGIAPNRGDQ